MPTFTPTALYQITSGEYIQMSGRAGRRGLDDRGIVMLMIDEKMDSTVGKSLLKVCGSLFSLSLSLSLSSLFLSLSSLN